MDVWVVFAFLVIMNNAAMNLMYKLCITLLKNTVLERLQISFETVNKSNFSLT